MGSILLSLQRPTFFAKKVGKETLTFYPVLFLYRKIIHRVTPNGGCRAGALAPPWGFTGIACFWVVCRGGLQAAWSMVRLQPHTAPQSRTHFSVGSRPHPTGHDYRVVVGRAPWPRRRVLRALLVFGLYVGAAYRPPGAWCGYSPTPRRNLGPISRWGQDPTLRSFYHILIHKKGMVIDHAFLIEISLVLSL